MLELELTSYTPQSQELARVIYDYHVMKVPVTIPRMTRDTQALAVVITRVPPPVNVMGAGDAGVLALLACVRTPLKLVPSLIPPTGAHRR